MAGMDLGRYFITQHSLRTLVSEAVRATLVSCYGSTTTCTLPSASKTTVAAKVPFLASGSINWGTANQGAPNAIGPQSIFQVQPTPFLGNCDPTRAATAHAGGIQVGLVDGSVRTLAPSLSGDTWAAAVTRAGGEVLGPDW